MKLATVTAWATVDKPLSVVDLESNRSEPANYLAANDICTVLMRLDRLIAMDCYSDNLDTGSFILIDLDSLDTVALGIVEAVKPAVRRTATNLRHLVRSTETHARSIAKAISWRVTGSFDTFVLAALVTGNSKIAGAVALAEKEAARFRQLLNLDGCNYFAYGFLGQVDFLTVILTLCEGLNDVTV